MLKFNLLGSNMRHCYSPTNFEIFHLFKYISQKRRRSWRSDLNLIRSLLVLERPLSYILPTHNFLNSSLKILPGILIPRNETEEYVSHLIKKLNEFRAYSSKKLRILDLCTGSGCIAIALACNVSNVDILALDSSKKSILNTSINIERNIERIGNLGSSVTTYRIDLLKDDLRLDHKYDIIISNPPYIPVFNRKKVDRNVLKFESKKSLFPPSIRYKGLLFHHTILNLSQKCLNYSCSSKKIPKVLLEFDGTYQVSEILRMAKASGFRHVYFRKDFQNKPRSIWIY